MRIPSLFHRVSLLSISAIAAIAFSGALASGCAHAGVDLERVDAELKGAGTMGFVHGRAAYPGASGSANVEYTVFTLREAGDFFSHYEAPLVGATVAVTATLRTLGRHDQIRVRGEFVSNGAPVRHIRVRELDLVKKYEPGTPPLPAYQYEARIPDELVGAPSFVGKVHAVAEGGRILVVEYRDVVLPLFPRANSTALVRDLFRGDTIRVFHQIRSEPEAPSHLMFDPAVAVPLVRLQRLQDLHGQTPVMTGFLAKFPKSPQITTDVYALISTNEHGVAHDFTLANLQDPAVFVAIREKLQAVWNANTATMVQGRNQLHNRKLRVTARGRLNVVAADQANPQILLDSADQVSVEVLP